MKYTADLGILKNEPSLISLQSIYSHKLVSFRRINGLARLLECYRAIINQFYKFDNIKWAGLNGIGLSELDDHMKFLIAASDQKTQQTNYNDCHNYLSASIQDAIDTEA